MSTKGLFGSESLRAKFGPMTLGLYLKSLREADEISQIDFARKLKISRANLCDLEKGRKIVSPERAARFAKILKVPETTMIKLALQDSLRNLKLNYIIELKRAA